MGIFKIGLEAKWVQLRFLLLYHDSSTGSDTCPGLDSICCCCNQSSLFFTCQGRKPIAAFVYIHICCHLTMKTAIFRILKAQFTAWISHSAKSAESRPTLLNSSIPSTVSGLWPLDPLALTQWLEAAETPSAEMGRRVQNMCDRQCFCQSQQVSKVTRWTCSIFLCHMTKCNNDAERTPVNAGEKVSGKIAISANELRLFLVQSFIFWEKASVWLREFVKAVEFQEGFEANMPWSAIPENWNFQSC